MDIAIARTKPMPEISKRSQLITLLERNHGASLDDIVAATGWLPHTTRAALAGFRKSGLILESGKVGNLDRPGLNALLADIGAGKVDIILLYKIDRLTRSLSDFARIVDILDKAGASFVSITQSFNTTTRRKISCHFNLQNCQGQART